MQTKIAIVGLVIFMFVAAFALGKAIAQDQELRPFERRAIQSRLDSASHNLGMFNDMGDILELKRSIDKYEEVLKTDSDNKTARGMLDVIREKYKSEMEVIASEQALATKKEADELIANKDYKKGVELYHGLFGKYPDCLSLRKGLIMGLSMNWDDVKVDSEVGILLGDEVAAYSRLNKDDVFVNSLGAAMAVFLLSGGGFRAISTA